MPDRRAEILTEILINTGAEPLEARHITAAILDDPRVRVTVLRTPYAEGGVIKRPPPAKVVYLPAFNNDGQDPAS